MSLRTAVNPRRGGPTVSVKHPKLQFGLGLTLLAMALGWLVRHWRLVGLAVAGYGLYRFAAWLGPVGLGLLVVAVAAPVATAARLWPEAWRTHVVARLRSRWRAARVYRREWAAATALSGLAPTVGGRLYLPRIRSFSSVAGLDVVRVEMVRGQVVEDWVKNAPRMAPTLGLRDLRVKPVHGRPRQVELHGMTAADPLTALVPVPRPETSFGAVRVGRREDGRPHAIGLLHNHLLIGGATGSGKGSVIWSLILGMAPLIQRDLVRVWAIDPKGGMELNLGRPLFARFAYGAVGAEIADLLDFAVECMNKRAERLRQAGVRKLEPSTAEPLIVIVIDELASLTAYVTDTAVKKRITNSLGLLLTQGRAVGVSVVAATQDVRKEVLAMRDLFSTRVCLRTNEADQVDMTLGRGSRERGAFADKIAPSTPGVGYVLVEDQPDPIRVRFAHTTDAKIEAAVRRYGHQPVTT